MSRFTARALLLAISLAAFATARAQIPAPTAAAPVAPLTLEECIARAMRKNFDLQIQGYSTDLARESLTIAKADFDPNLTASVTRNYSESASASNRLDGTVAVGPSSDNTTTRVGVNDKLPQTGGIVSVNSNLSRAASNSTNSLFNPTFGDAVSVSLSQPLLKNAGPTVTKANVETAKLGVSIAVLNYKSRVLGVIRDTENAYYNLVAARETLRIRQLSLELAQKLLDENTARQIAGVLTDLDVLSAEVGVANARRAVIQADQGVFNSEDALLGLFTPDDFNNRPGVVTFKAYTDPVPTFAVSYKLARDSFPDTLSTEDQIKQLEISLAVAKINRLPSLNLDASYGYTGKATDQGYSEVIDTLPNDHGNNWSLALSYSVSWGRRADKARYRSAALNLNSQKLRLAQLEQALLVNIRSAVRAVEANLASVDIAAKATEFSAKQYELQKARFDAGLSTSRLVLQAQDDLESARLNELTTRVALSTSAAELHRLEGTSLQRFNINLP